MSPSLVVQRPTVARHLLLLFHGVGANAQHLVPLGQRLGMVFPDAVVASVNAPRPGDRGEGWQWFSVRKVTDDNRRERIDEALPAFAHAIADWQQTTKLGPAATTLIGFSQGGIMALESLRRVPAAAERVVSIAGRLAHEPRPLSARAVVHLLHGEGDTVIPSRHSEAAAQRLSGAGAVVTLDIVSGVGHSLDRRLEDRLLARLQAGAQPASACAGPGIPT